MPYIAQHERGNYWLPVQRVVEELVRWRGEEPVVNPGHLNYVLSSIVVSLFRRNERYATLNLLLGALEAVKLELYRVYGAPYEDRKRAENGEVDVH